MDEPMKEIAWQAFADHDGGVERSMMAACEAVLAEHERREPAAPRDEEGWLIERGGLCIGKEPACSGPAWVTFTDPGAIRFTRKVDAENMLQSLQTFGKGKAFADCIVTGHTWVGPADRESAAQEPQMANCVCCGHSKSDHTGTEPIGSFKNPCIRCECGRYQTLNEQSAPADDVVERIPSDLRARYKSAKFQLSVLPTEPPYGDGFVALRSQCREVIELIERIAALAVAREGYVPASELQAALEGCLTTTRNLERELEANLELKQQLATMSGELRGWKDGAEIEREEYEELCAESSVHPSSCCGKYCANAVFEEIGKLQQQLATMYTKEQVENFLLRFGQLNDCGALMGKVSREMRAGITAPKPEPTPQEKVTKILKKWADADDDDGTNEKCASEIAAEIIAALNGGK